MILLDGSQGEGGGQILRTALSLSLVTGIPVHLVNLRARRSNPGLRAQHVAALNAAAAIGGAEVSGAALGSMEVTFVPHEIRAGDWHFGVGTAGSVTLVLQTLLPALMMAAAPSTLILEGGTHNPMAPPFEFIAEAWLPLLRHVGPRVKVKLDRHGFYPEGGGKVRVVIEPVSSLRPLILVERGPVVRCCATVLIGDLPRHVAEREMKVLKRELGLEAKAVRWEAIRSRSPVNVVWVTVETPGVTEVFTAFGAKGVRAETVAGQLAKTVLRYLEAGVPVGEHLADQLLLPLALAGGGSFVSLPLTSHSLTNIEVIERFLPVRIESQPTGEESGSARCEVRRANGEAGGG